MTGHRSFKCPSKFGTAQADKGGKTTLFAGTQAVQQVEMNGQTWVAFQGNLRLKLPAQILQGDDLEKPVFKLPEPAMARINEILTGYVSKCESAGPAVRVHVKVPL